MVIMVMAVLSLRLMGMFSMLLQHLMVVLLLSTTVMFCLATAKQAECVCGDDLDAFGGVSVNGFGVEVYGYVKDDVTRHRSVNGGICRRDGTISVKTVVMDLMGTALLL